MTRPIHLELYTYFKPSDAAHMRTQGTDMEAWDYALFIAGAELHNVAEDVTLNRLFLACIDSRWADVTMPDGRRGVLGIGR